MRTMRRMSTIMITLMHTTMIMRTSMTTGTRTTIHPRRNIRTRDQEAMTRIITIMATTNTTTPTV